MDSVSAATTISSNTVTELTSRAIEIEVRSSLISNERTQVAQMQSLNLCDGFSALVSWK